MKKNDRIAAFVETLGADDRLALDPRYQGWFTCFNAQQYYEAHDVLENLWLQTRGPDYLFFKGLIQLAGAFVHLQKQFLHPDHHKHGRRLRPAVRLFLLALTNLEPYSPLHHCLDVEEVCRLCRRYMDELAAAHFERNPWSPERAPQIQLLTA